ncbi:MAG: hypothetical protein Kow0074_25880 [Candidatus Zixiibacteriota bacterium]
MKRMIWLGIAVFALLTMHASVSFADSWWGSGWKTVRGSGKQAEETRAIKGVEAVEYGTVGVLYISIGDKEELVISGDDNLLGIIETEVAGNTLIIESETGKSPKPRQPLRFYLTVKSLRSIEISSSGDVEIEDDIDADRFRIESHSSGDLRMAVLSCEEADITIGSSGDIEIEHLTADQLDVEIGSSGDLTIRDGSVTEQDVQIHSSGDYKARDLVSRHAYVRTSSSGDAHVYVTEFLDAETSSSGDINFYGNPRLRMDESSSGDVRRAGR